MGKVWQRGEKALWRGVQVEVVGQTGNTVDVREASGQVRVVHVGSLTPLPDPPKPIGVEAIADPEVRGVLKEIRRVLGLPGGRHLATVLAAFRGPDDPALNTGVKETTTAVVRYHAFGPVAGGYQTNNASSVSAASLNTARAERSGKHFADHLKEAAEVLGIPIR
jgi:hypothetical protein